LTGGSKGLHDGSPTLLEHLDTFFEFLIFLIAFSLSLAKGGCKHQTWLSG
jgi:hypothetical protein